MLRKRLALLSTMVLSVILLFGCASPATSPTPTTPPAGTGNLQIDVKDMNNNPLMGAKVVSNTQPEGQLKVTGITEASGTVTFNGIKAGEYQFYITRFDYLQEEVEITVVAGQTTVITVKLTMERPSPSPA